MLVSGRIAEVRRLAGQLTRVCASMRTQAVASTTGLQAQREKMLFRRAPVALSLVERSLSPVARCPTTGSASADGTHHFTPLMLTDSNVSALSPSPTSAPPSALHSVGLRQNITKGSRVASAVLGLLHPLHVLESERKRLLGEKRAAIEQRRARLVHDLAHVTAQLSSPGLGNSRRRHARRTRDETPITAEDSQADVHTELALQQAVSMCEEDLAVLHDSLVARPFLSAKLWRRLLVEEAWAGLVRAAATATPGDPVPQARLLRQLLYLSQLTLGVVVGYVEGCDVNRASPRFVASLPSAAWRERARSNRRDTQHAAVNSDTLPHSSEVDTANPAAQSAHDDDPLMGMLLETMVSSPVEADVKTDDAHLLRSQEERRRPTTLRWLPAHASRSVLALAQETLALISFVLPHLDVSLIVAANKSEALLTLLVTVQQLARVSVSAYPVQPPPQEGEDLPRVLGQLQSALLQAACELKEALVSVCASREGGAAAIVSFNAWQPTPRAAARFLVEMDALYLLRPGEPSSDALIDHLVLCLFPQLRTKTFEVLQQKTEATSLLAFTTRRHRSHLYRQHNGRAGVTQFLEGTVIQQARLQNRQLAAALRERRLNDIHLRSLSDLAASLEVADLLGLFQLLVLRAHTAHESTDSTRGAAEEVLACDRAVTAALFVAEALLLSGATRVSVDSGDALLSPEQTARLWLALVTLSPVVAHRDAMRRATASAGRGHGHGKAGSHAEKAALTFLAEFALTSLSAVLAQNVAAPLKSKHANATLAQSDAADATLAPPTTAGLRAHGAVVQSMAVGLAEWGANSRGRSSAAAAGMGTGGPHNAALEEAVHTALKLLHKTLLQDTRLWHEVRSWDAAHRQSFERALLGCFHMHDLLDNALGEAIEGMCYRGAA